MLRKLLKDEEHETDQEAESDIGWDDVGSDDEVFEPGGKDSEEGPTRKGGKGKATKGTAKTASNATARGRKKTTTPAVKNVRRTCHYPFG